MRSSTCLIDRVTTSPSRRSRLTSSPLSFLELRRSPRCSGRQCGGEEVSLALRAPGGPHRPVDRRRIRCVRMVPAANLPIATRVTAASSLLALLKREQLCCRADVKGVVGDGRGGGDPFV